MNFNVYLDDEIGLALRRATDASGKSRNAIIRTAVAQWLDRNGNPGWPATVLAFTGIPDFPRFESGRDDLAAPSKDPFR